MASQIIALYDQLLRLDPSPLLSLEDLRVDRGTLDRVDESTGGIIDTVPASIAVLAASRSLPMCEPGVAGSRQQPGTGTMAA
jgi:hypothetical protein